MKRDSGQRKLVWTTLDSLGVDSFLKTASEIEKFVGGNANITLEGSPSGLNISGTTSQVLSDVSTLIPEDKDFSRGVVAITITIAMPPKPLKPPRPAVTQAQANISIVFDFSSKLITAVMPTAYEKSKELFALLKNSHPRYDGPSEEEITLILAKLGDLQKEYEKALQSSRELDTKAKGMLAIGESLKDLEKSSMRSYEEGKRLIDDLKDKKSSFDKLILNISGELTEAKLNREKVSKLWEEATNLNAEIKTLGEKILEKVAMFDGKHHDLESFITLEKNKMADIRETNLLLQDEIKKKLQGATGLELFGQFRDRKHEIGKGKDTWRNMIVLGALLQFAIIIWIAYLASQHSGGSNIYSFFISTEFILRLTTSLPVLFIIIYSIRQYSNERKYEEIYAFKSVISFSLAPYMDLVDKLTKEEHKKEYADFVVTSIGNIFDDPISKSKDCTSKDISELKEVVEFIEKIKNITTKS